MIVPVVQSVPWGSQLNAYIITNTQIGTVKPVYCNYMPQEGGRERERGEREGVGRDKAQSPSSACSLGCRQGQV